MSILLTRVTGSLVLACLIAVSSAAARDEAQGAQPFVVTTTLDGKSVLPHRIRWHGRPRLPASQVSKVEFLIDGKLRWSEMNPPYAYGDDSNWLVTSWLAPGLHRFTVRVSAKDGRTAEQTTNARVVSPPRPPAELTGTWTRGSYLPWVITIDKAGWKIRDPYGGGHFIDVAYLPGRRLQARGGVWTKPQSDDEGNGWCPDTNTPVNYRWTVSGDGLTLTHSGPDGCGAGGEKQHEIWDGEWTRVG